MDFTFVTIIIEDQYRASAQPTLGQGFFTVGLSESGQSPATHWMSSGPFNNDELDKICNQTAWPYLIKFGQDWQSAISTFSLKIVEIPSNSVNE